MADAQNHFPSVSFRKVSPASLEHRDANREWKYIDCIITSGGGAQGSPRADENSVERTKCHRCMFVTVQNNFARVLCVARKILLCALAIFQYTFL